MSLSNLDSLPANNSTRLANRSELISRYQRIRTVGFNLNNRLAAGLSREVLLDGGQRLGIRRGGKLIFNSEDESSVLMDYCLYDVRRNGRSAVEQALIQSSLDPESDEMICLRTMQHATYSIFEVGSVEPGFGITVQDLLANETRLIIDMGLSSTAKPGLLIASRLLSFDGFSMTGGAAIPIGLVPEDLRHDIVEKLEAAIIRDRDGYCDPAPLIRACLSRGLMDSVSYQDAHDVPIPRQGAPLTVGSAKVGRNSPCPCGSGRKFKNCCLK